MRVWDVTPSHTCRRQRSVNTSVGTRRVHVALCIACALHGRGLDPNLKHPTHSPPSPARRPPSASCLHGADLSERVTQGLSLWVWQASGSLPLRGPVLDGAAVRTRGSGHPCPDLRVAALVPSLITASPCRRRRGWARPGGVHPRVRAVGAPVLKPCPQRGHPRPCHIVRELRHRRSCWAQRPPPRPPRPLTGKTGAGARAQACDPCSPRSQGRMCDTVTPPHACTRPHGPRRAQDMPPHLQAPGSGRGTEGAPAQPLCCPGPCARAGGRERGGGPRAAVAGTWALWRFRANVWAALAAFPPGGHLTL